MEPHKEPIAADFKLTRRFVYSKPISPTESTRLDFTLGIDNQIELSAYYAMLLQAAEDVKKTLAWVNTTKKI